MKSIQGVISPTKLIETAFIASPLFSEAEREFNNKLCAFLDTAQVRSYLPQRDCGLMADLIKEGQSLFEASECVYRANLLAIQECDFVVAVLDGPQVDDGVAFELGYARCLGKLCVGLLTDVRRDLGKILNPMIENSLSALFLTPGELLEWLREKHVTPAS